MKSIWIIMALLAGVFLPIQGGINARLGKEIASPIHASLISFVIGAVGLFLYTLLVREPVQMTGFKTAPLYLWSGGLFGAFCVTMIILAFPKIGPTLTFSLVIAGQIIMSLLLDHFDILVAQPHPVNIWKLSGVLLVVAGVIIIRKF